MPGKFDMHAHFERLNARRRRDELFHRAQAALLWAGLFTGIVGVLGGMIAWLVV